MSLYPPNQKAPRDKDAIYADLFDSVNEADGKSAKEGRADYDLAGEIHALGEVKEYADERLAQILKPAASQDEDKDLRQPE